MEWVRYKRVLETLLTDNLQEEQALAVNHSSTQASSPINNSNKAATTTSTLMELSDHDLSRTKRVSHIRSVFGTHPD